KMFSNLSKLVIILLPLSTYGTVENSWASSSFRQGRLTVTPINSYQTRTAAMCLRACQEVTSCTAYNYQASSKTCELLGNRLCDRGLDLELTDDATWRYYDTQATQDQEKNIPTYNTNYCTVQSRCSSHCGKVLGDSCDEDVQCNAGDLEMYCKPNNNESS
ncbi:unnamed protein product, partial [Meganyctiphanes norvegica]